MKQSPLFFAAEKMLRARSLKEATATCSLTRSKDFPKLFPCSGSLRTMSFTATRYHQHSNNPPSVLLTNQNKNALFTSYLSQTSKPLETKTHISSLLPCIAERDGPASNPTASATAAPCEAAEGGSPNDSHRRQLEQVRPARDCTSKSSLR